MSSSLSEETARNAVGRSAIGGSIGAFVSPRTLICCLGLFALGVGVALLANRAGLSRVKCVRASDGASLPAKRIDIGITVL